MKNKSIIYTISTFLLISGLFLSFKGANAEVASFQTVDLEPGWNIFSTPKVLTSHEFSISETSSNFDIYLLNPSSPSGWQTMQEAGQTEFAPLYAYFVNNKTGQNQTLTLNHNLNLTPDQRLFKRALHPGWNAIGVASPSYAIPRGTVVADTNNPNKILSSIINSTGSVIDFRSSSQLIDSLKISDSWTQVIASDVNNLNDFREYKGYGIFITSETNNYNGIQNNDPTLPPPDGCVIRVEGSYTATLSSTPVSRTVNGGAGIEAYGINIRAIDSNINIESLDLQISVIDASTAVAQNPETFISGIKIYKDSVSSDNLVATYASPSFILDASSVYYTSLTNLNMQVASGTTNKLLVVLDTITSFDTNKTVILNVYGNGIKGKDCAEVDRFLALATTRTLTIQHPDIGILNVSLAGDNPNSQNIQSNATNGVTTDTTILKFNAKSTGGGTTLIRITVLYATGASEAIPSVLYLKNNTTTVASCTPTNAGCVFENFRLPIAADETKSMKVDANWSAMTDKSANVLRGINIPAAANGVVYERSDGNQIGANTAVLSSDLKGSTVFLFEQGLKFTLVSATATGGTIGSTQAGVASSTFNFTVQPFGGTLSQITYATSATECVNSVLIGAYWADGSKVYASGTDNVISKTLAQTPARNLADGETGTLSVNVNVSSTTSYGTGTLRFKIDGLQWTVGGNNIYQGEFNNTENKGADFTDTWLTPWVTMQ